jgi:hypothetical protein
VNVNTNEISPLEVCGGAGEPVRLLAGEGGQQPPATRPGVSLPLELVFIPAQDHAAAIFTVVAETPEGDRRLCTGGLGAMTGGEQSSAVTTVRPSAELAGQTVNLRFEVAGDDELEVAARFAVAVAA